MKGKAVVLALLVGWLLAFPQAQAYQVEIDVMKLHEGGLPSQGGSFDFDVGMSYAYVGRSPWVDDQDIAWNRWESRMNSGVSTTFRDVGDIVLPTGQDEQNTVQMVQDGPGWLGRNDNYGGSSEPWRIVESDMRLNKTDPDHCWGDCPFFCGIGKYEMDIISIATHEYGHGHGLVHCTGCNSIMIPGYPGGECTQLDLGSVDETICDDMYRHGTYDSNEPDDDTWDGANVLDTINGSMQYEEAMAEGDLGAFWITTSSTAMSPIARQRA